MKSNEVRISMNKLDKVKPRSGIHEKCSMQASRPHTHTGAAVGRQSLSDQCSSPSLLLPLALQSFINKKPTTLRSPRKLDIMLGHARSTNAGQLQNMLT